MKKSKVSPLATGLLFLVSWAHAESVKSLGNNCARSLKGRSGAVAFAEQPVGGPCLDYLQRVIEKHIGKS